ncbi:MAG: hypothetical protein HXX12_14995 [Geothrix sp.]|uniref:DUF7544 domain-containing protein n=1 Tax=Geothrix sp. TaxID=1962974 RepID=UPI0017A2588E|nr:hypothetical protein [Geothrix sp.]NWJ42268.1 hypothetical protein [Geothrix sp.]WIL19765.1 MAG: hypothetical protein QOZ81_002297 [Geothrix sp.]
MVSVTDPIQPAIAHAKRILFQPFSARKWFVLGFSAFLAHLGGGGGSFNYNGNPFDHSSPGAQPDFSPVTSWISEHLPLVIALAVVFFVLMLALAVLFQWLSSRGQLMFLDGVVRDRAEIVEPWNRLRHLGDDLFRFRLMLLLATLALFIVCGGLGALIALPDIHARTFGGAALAGVLVGCGLLILGVLVLSLVGALLHDFVVPIMYHRDLRVPAAWQVLRRELLPGHGWHFVGYYLMGFLLGIGAAILMLLACCLTCCVAMLPYISSVVFLPLFVFFRCYSLEFLAQFGDEWRIIQVPEPVVEP